MLKNAVLDAKIYGNLAKIWRNFDKILTKFWQNSDDDMDSLQTQAAQAALSEQPAAVL